MRLKVGVSRREATDGDSSVGATCEIEVEVPGGTGEAELARIRDRWLEMCENTVDDEIDRLRSTAVRPPAPARDRSAPSRSMAHDGRTAAPNLAPASAPARRARDEFHRDDDRDRDRDRDREAPTNGRQLLGWAAKQDPDAKGLIFSFGKKKGYPPRIVDWTDDQVNAAYRFARDRQVH